ncbi:MAG: divergent polysaccharide deacetylase family protein [Proteobacteria bacterium]|nr:divergent polysaccharide deacetylase family protein [Pseudomonadota bacterium]
MTQKNPEKKGRSTPVKRGGKGTGKKKGTRGATSSPGVRKGTGSRNETSTRPFLWTLVGLFFLIGVVIGTGWIVHQLFPPEELTEKQPFEIYPKEEPLHTDRPDRTVIPFPERPDRTVIPFQDRPEVLPEVAIIIDDIGYSRTMARKFGDLDMALTFSVLPKSPHRREIAAEAHGNGIEIMLHLPMEPMEFPRVKPGPGALLVSMDVDDMIDVLYDDLDDVPYVVGVNNHMGSRMTAISTRMYQIFTVLKKNDLFFIDSRTSAQSLCKPSARLLQVTYGERDIFLDHSVDKETIRKQIRALIHLAVKTGHAIAIGHPHRVTYEVLSEELPELKKKVRLVHASDLVRPLG